MIALGLQKGKSVLNDSITANGNSMAKPLDLQLW